MAGAFYCVLEFARPGHSPVPIGVLMYVPGPPEFMFVRCREQWRDVTDDDDEIELLAALSDDLSKKATELGSRWTIEYLENTLSNAILISERHVLPDSSATRRHFDHIYEQVITPARPDPNT